MPFLRPIEYSINRFHPKQEDAWLAYKAGKDLVLDWGRRSGKSSLIAEVIIEDMEDYGKDCMYIAISQAQAREIIWPTFEKILEANREWAFNGARLELRHLPSNAKCALKGADLGKDRLRGGGKRIIALDEYAFFRDPSIVKDVLMPQLADYNGQLIYCSTPKGKNHFWKLKNRAKDNPKFFTSQCTMFDNPFMSDAGRKKMIAEYAGEDDPLYRQEILGEYVIFEGMVFALDIETYTERRWDPADLTHSWHWRSMDHGFNPDPSAALWMAFNERKGHYQVYSDYKQARLLIKDHADLIKAQEPYPVLATYSDIDPQVIAEYKAVGLDMIAAEKTSIEMRRQARLLGVVNALRLGHLKITDNCKFLLEEMASYVWDQEDNNHCIDALIYLWHNKTMPRAPVQQQVYPRKFATLPGHEQGVWDQNLED